MRVDQMDWFNLLEATGAIFALLSIALSSYIMVRVRRGASVWIYLSITSFCMFFGMLLGVLGAFLLVDQAVQRLQQYIFLLAGALAFALSGIELHKTFHT
ncbi:hypothetical protein KEJ39_03820 [Candidatus Bathyarchaeota archaeon]|nr:hypothetical protein [Candidatus Bathyarchaeota archaeon]